MNDQDTMLSRADGKKICRLDVPVSEELEAAVISLATIAGISRAEWVRIQLERIVHGELVMLRRMTQQASSRQLDVGGRNVG
jgi:hypothetical protein